MKQQVVVIHGGRTFESYGQYIESLKTREVTVDTFKVKKEWRDLLGQELGESFEVFNPKMPNGNNAVYEEWKIWFERMAVFLQDGTVFIGHSMGGIFLAKYLSENTFNKKIKAVFLVASPFDDVQPGEFLTGFELLASFKVFLAQVPKTYLFFSKDDTVVPFTEAGKYKNVLPNSELIAFENRQHFGQPDFPELVNTIKEL